ncbi:MAG: PQQ-binding-like beta-propeller repeat protein [Rhodothermales bacterium]
MKYPRFILFSLLLVVSSGCLKLKVSHDMTPGEGDWAMEGATVQRQHTAQSTIDPPLYEQWRYDAGAGTGPSGVLVVNDIVIVGTRKGLVHGMNLSNGKRIGRIKHDAPIEGGMTVGDGMLFVPVAGDKKSVVAYNLRSGKKLWTLKGQPVEAGLLYTDGKVIAVDRDAHVIAIDATTGEELWRTLLADRTTVVASPLAIGDKVYVTDELGSLFALQLQDGQLLWDVGVGAPVYNTATTDGELIYVPTTRGRLSAIDASNGQLVWQFALPDSSVRFSTPAYSPAKKQLVVSATNGEVRSFDASSGEVNWMTSLDGAISAAPLFTDQTVYVGTMRKNLHAIDATTGIELWSHEVTGRVKSAVTGYGNGIIVTAETQMILSFTPDEPEVEGEETP